MKAQKGFSILELVIAAAAFILFATAAVGIFAQSLSVSRLSGEQIIATSYVAEGLDALSSIAARDFNHFFFIPEDYPASLQTVGSNWELNQGVPENLANNGKTYTRTVNIYEVYRDSNNNNQIDHVRTMDGFIEASVDGVYLDPDTWKVTVTVTWPISSGHTGTHTAFTYVTNNKKTILSANTDNCNPTPMSGIAQSYNMTGTQAGYKIALGDRSKGMAYVARRQVVDADLDFQMLSAQYPSAISPLAYGVTSVSVAGTINNLFARDTRIYFATNDATKEFQIYTIHGGNFNDFISSSPTGYVNLPTAANDVWVDFYGGYAYVVTDDLGIGNNNFFKINVSVPSAPTIVGQTRVQGNLKSVIVKNRWAYVASSNTSNEVVAVDTLSPHTQNPYNIPTAFAAVSLAVSSHFLIVGNSAGEIYFLNISSPSNISPSKNVVVSDSPVNDLVVDPTKFCVYSVSAKPLNQLSVVNFSNIDDQSRQPTIDGTVNMSTYQTGVDYSLYDGTGGLYTVGPDFSGTVHELNGIFQ